MVSKNEKSLGLKEQINHIDTQINDLKKLVENKDLELKQSKKKIEELELTSKFNFI